MATQTYLDKAKKLLLENPFFQLSKSWCPDCHYASKIWDEYGVSDKVFLLELDKIDPEEAQKLEEAFTEIAGRKWVPTIFFHGKVLGTEQDLKDWKKQNKLDEVFKKEKLIN